MSVASASPVPSVGGEDHIKWARISAGGVVGIAIGGVIAVCLIVLASYFCCCSQACASKRKQRQHDLESADASQSPTEYSYDKSPPSIPLDENTSTISETEPERPRPIPPRRAETARSPSPPSYESVWDSQPPRAG